MKILYTKLVLQKWNMHKSEELAERGARYGTRKLKQGYRSHKLKPYREAAKAEQAAFKANVNFQYHKALQENPQLTSNPFSRFMQKQKIKRQYAKTVKKGGAATAKAAAGASQTAAKKAAAFAGQMCIRDRTIKRKITDLDKMKIEEQKKAVRSGYDIDILPSDLASPCSIIPAVSRNVTIFLF